MLFVATLSHDPANCWMRGENRQAAKEWIDGMDERADVTDVTVHGAYVTPNEHTFYIILEADDLEAVTDFLGPPFLPDHTGDIAPVMPLRDASEAFKKRKE